MCKIRINKTDFRDKYGKKIFEVFHKIHRLTNTPRSYCIMDGEKYVRLSSKKYCEENNISITRFYAYIKILRTAMIISTRQLKKYKLDNTNYYRIDYERLPILDIRIKGIEEGCKKDKSVNILEEYS